MNTQKISTKKYSNNKSCNILLCQSLKETTYKKYCCNNSLYFAEDKERKGIDKQQSQGWEHFLCIGLLSHMQKNKVLEGILKYIKIQWIQDEAFFVDFSIKNFKLNDHRQKTDYSPKAQQVPLTAEKQKIPGVSVKMSFFINILLKMEIFLKIIAIKWINCSCWGV